MPPTTRTLQRDDWMTPPEVFGPVNALFRFDIDLAAGSRHEARVKGDGVRPAHLGPGGLVPDALDEPRWGRYGRRGWLNAPYGHAGPGAWMARAALAVAGRNPLDLVVANTYAKVGTVWWYDYVARAPTTRLVIIVKGRIPYALPEDVGVGPDGEELWRPLTRREARAQGVPQRKPLATGDSALVVYGRGLRSPGAVPHVYWPWRTGRAGLEEALLDGLGRLEASRLAPGLL